MTKVIEFRGRHIINGMWVYGYLLGEDIIGEVQKIEDDAGVIRPTIIKHCTVDKSTVSVYTGINDRNKHKIYEGDIVRVYDIERGCVCNEWEDCDGLSGKSCEEHGHGNHEHENHTDCENFICIQKVEWSDYSGYFCDEDTGDFCPSLNADEIELELIGNIHDTPELLKND